MMFVHGPAKVVSNVADGKRQSRDEIKQIRVELDNSRLKCGILERDVNNAKVGIFFVDDISVIFKVATVSVAQWCSHVGTGTMPPF